jgi:hypothetical protein
LNTIGTEDDGLKQGKIELPPLPKKTAKKDVLQKWITE